MPVEHFFTNILYNNKIVKNINGKIVNQFTLDGVTYIRKKPKPPAPSGPIDEEVLVKQCPQLDPAASNLDIMYEGFPLASMPATSLQIISVKDIQTTLPSATTFIQDTYNQIHSAAKLVDVMPDLALHISNQDILNKLQVNEFFYGNVTDAIMASTLYAEGNYLVTPFIYTTTTDETILVAVTGGGNQWLIFSQSDVQVTTSKITVNLPGFQCNMGNLPPIGIICFIKVPKTAVTL